MELAPLPIRKRRSICVQLDPMAEQLLRAMAVAIRGSATAKPRMGAVVSEAIRELARTWDEQPQLRQRLGEQDEDEA